MSAFLIGLFIVVFLLIPNSVLAANTSSLNFDGSNDYVEADGVNSPVVNANELSFGMWARRTNFSVALKALGGFYTSSGTNLNTLFWGTGVNPQKFVYFDASGQTASSHTFNAAKWHHAFVTIDASNNGVLYVNGESEATFTTTSRPGSSGLFSIGQDWDGGSTSDFFNGQIDDVRVYNKTLTQDQVKKVMRDDYGDDLVAYFKFDENTGCRSFDAIAGYQAVLQSDCASGDAPTWHSTIKAPLGVAGPNINDGVQSKGSGDYKFIGRTTVENSYIVDSINYSINNSGWRGVGIKDGVNDEADEEFEFTFRSDDNNPGYEGYLLDVRVTDSGNRESHRVHFEPFNLTSVQKLSDGTLQLKFNVHQNRNLMKDKLKEYQIVYTGSPISKTLLQNIPIDFDSIRDSSKNLKPGQAICSNCIYEDTNMIVEYSNNNSTILVTTKNKFTEPEGKYTFKVVAQSKDNLAYESNGKILDTTTVTAVKTTKTSVKPATLGVTASPTPSPSPKPTISTYTPPEPNSKPSQGESFDLGQLFVNFHLWLFSLLPWVQ